MFELLASEIALHSSEKYALMRITVNLALKQQLNKMRIIGVNNDTF